MQSSLAMLVIKVKKKRPFGLHSHPTNALPGKLYVLFTVKVEHLESMASQRKGTDLK